MKKYLKLFLLLLCMILIFYLSNDSGVESTKKSDYVVHLFTNYSDFSIFLVRKSAHAIIYFLLGFLMINYLSEFSISRKIVIAILCCIFYAITDEIHQTFLIGRSGELTDVLLDSFFSMIGIFIFRFIHRKGGCL